MWEGAVNEIAIDITFGLPKGRRSWRRRCGVEIDLTRPVIAVRRIYRMRLWDRGWLHGLQVLVRFVNDFHGNSVALSGIYAWQRNLELDDLRDVSRAPKLFIGK